jgi:hypothetical protein
MNTLLRNSFKSIRSLALLNNVTKPVQTRAYNMLFKNKLNPQSMAMTITDSSINCKCNCAGMSQLHTKGKI